MNEVWNLKCYWFSKLDFFMPGTMLILCTIILSPSFLKIGQINVPLPECNLLRKFLLDFWTLLTKLPKKYFDTLKYWTRGICGLKKIQFLFGVLWWTIIIDIYLVFSTFCYYLNVCLFNSMFRSVLY